VACIKVEGKVTTLSHLYILLSLLNYMQRLNIQKEGSLGRGERIAGPWKRALPMTKRCSRTTEMVTWSLLTVMAAHGSLMAASGTDRSTGRGASKKTAATSTVVLRVVVVVATLVTVNRRSGGTD
jgi:hypothetical protein